MKKSLFYVLAICAMFILPFSVKAAELSVSCEKSCPTENGKCEQTCKIDVKGNKESLTLLVPTLTLTGDADKVTVKSVSGGEGWTATQSRTGNVVSFNFIATTAVTTEDFTLGTFVLELEDASVNCSGTFKLSDAEATITTTTTETVKTGAALPIAILTIGAGVAVVAYIVASKNKKLYKIN